jgi:UDP-N-acetylglucosamine 2-epimerase (non-hydrolysing)
MIRVLSIFGTRPEAIKMAPVVHRLGADPDFESIVCVTAQHRDMLDQVLDLFELVPEEDLDLMLPGQNLHDLSARAISGLRPVLEKHRPDVVLVHGDTTTSLCAALAAFYLRIPIGHVEAGLRTGDLSSPFPEEGNRVLTDKLSSFHFAPTQRAADNLLREGVPKDWVQVTGNTVIDALLWIRDRLEPISDFSSVYGSAGPLLAENRPFVLVTGHRRESFGGGFQRICKALKRIAQTHPEVDLVYPVHLNPNVQAPVNSLLSSQPNIHLIPPLAYMDFVRLMDRCHFILTDSGGIQEEAPSLGKPTLVMRDKTERPEGVAAGVVKLVGTDEEKIFSHSHALLTEPGTYADMTRGGNPYGDGKASDRIAEALRKRLS